jgi:hypothetical protein
MKKTSYKLFGVLILEVTRYEDEAEIPLKVEKGGGEVLEISEKELDKMEEDLRTKI